MNHRNQTLYRTVATLTGDITIGLLFSSICIWIINFAALGIFLSFLAWLIVTIWAMAASQYLIHPPVNFLLSDRKLERAVQKVHGLTGVFIQVGHAAAEKAHIHLWRMPIFAKRCRANRRT